MSAKDKFGTTLRTPHQVKTHPELNNSFACYKLWVMLEHPAHANSDVPHLQQRRHTQAAAFLVENRPKSQSRPDQRTLALSRRPAVRFKLLLQLLLLLPCAQFIEYPL